MGRGCSGSVTSASAGPGPHENPSSARYLKVNVTDMPDSGASKESPGQKAQGQFRYAVRMDRLGTGGSTSQDHTSTARVEVLPRTRGSLRGIKCLLV